MERGRENIIPLDKKAVKKLKKEFKKYIKKPNIFKRIINKFKK